MSHAPQVIITQQELNFLLRGLVPPEPVRINKSETRKLVVKSIFERWAHFYRLAMRADIDQYIAEPQRIGVRFERYFTEHTSLERRATLARMNSGDCGTTALAVGQVLELLGFEVNYCDLYDHACIIVDDRYYDALVPNGVTERSEVYGYRSEGINGYTATIGTATLIHEQYLRADPLGALLVESFAKMFLLEYTYPFEITA